MFIIRLSGLAILIPDEEAKNVINSFQYAEVWNTSWDGKLQEKRDQNLTFTFGTYPEQPSEEDIKQDIPSPVLPVPIAHKADDDIPF